MRRQTLMKWIVAMGLAGTLATQANAGSTLVVTPHGATYSLTSPMLSVYIGGTVGNNQTTNVNQSSVVNVTGVRQIGDNAKVNVVQSGGVNTSTVAQTGHSSSVSVIQFGTGAISLLRVN